MPNQTYTPSQMAEAIASIGVATLQEKEVVVTQNGEQTITPDAGYDGFASVALTVDVPTGGGSVAEEKDVNFIDYDGTIVHSYTATEFATLSEMPENPTHEGLTAQGWNWSLSDAQAYVAKYGKLWIGQMYITDDGKTRIYIHLEKGRTSPYLGLGVSGTADVDWGDGTAHTTVTGTNVSTVINTLHNYPEATGDYVITIDITGSMSLPGHSSYGSQLLWKNVARGEGNRVYQSAIQRVEIGNNTVIGVAAFVNCHSLTSITIPDSVTTIGNYMFWYCFNLTSITIPDSVTSIGERVFSNCYNLTSITIPDSVTSIGGGYTFYYCYSLTNVTIPDNVTTIEGAIFCDCHSLTNVTIPDNVTSIGGSAFSSCYSLTSVIIPYSVTSIGNSAFSSCYSLTSVIIPDNVTSIVNNAFNGCGSLTSVIIPDNVTSIVNYAFQNCSSLTNVTIPASVTSIGGNAFANCQGLGFIRFESSTPPAVANITAWGNILTDCIIYVPSGTLSDYTSATNYPSSSTYTYVEY